MRSRIQGVKTWMVLLLAVAASAGVMGMGAGHAGQRDAGNGVLSGDLGLRFVAPAASGASSSSARLLLNAAVSQSWAIELASPNAQFSGVFGTSVAISGNLVVVGAPSETALGLSGAGHAYTFNAKTGALVSTLTSPNAVAFGNFGNSVATSGGKVVVGAPTETASGLADAGHAYTFNAKTGALISTLTSPNAQANGGFGSSVGISGATVVVGTPYESVSGLGDAGHAYTFNAKTGALISTLTSPNVQSSGWFANSVAIGGSTVVVGAPLETASGLGDAGHAYTFNAKTGALISTLTSPNGVTGGFFGQSVAIGGATIVVGAPDETASGQSSAGHAYTFNAKTGVPITTLTSPNAQAGGGFGSSVGIGGTRLVVGAYGESSAGLSGAGDAYTFNAKTGALISTLTSLNAQSGGAFGFSVAISTAKVVVGAHYETVFGLSNGGIVYLF